MAVAVRITPGKMSRDEYERVLADLGPDDEPSGRQFHAAYGDDEVHMFEVWESREQFDDYHGRRFAAMQSAGVDAGIAEIYSVHTHRFD